MSSVAVGSVLLLGQLRAALPDGRPYDVAKIPAALRAGSLAVIRSSDSRFVVEDKEHAHFFVTYAVTIFSKERRDWGELAVWYDKFRSVEDVSGAIYDASGERLRKLSSDDIKDYSAISGMSLYEDNRVRVAELYSDTYPYTVEFSYEVVFKGSLNWPVWYAQQSPDAVESSTFEAVAPANGGLRWWSNRAEAQPRVTEDRGTVTYRWEAKNLPSVSLDVTGYIEDITTIVRLAPTDFVLENQPGSMRSWSAFGAWVGGLSDGLTPLPEQAVQEVRALVRPEDTPREKARKVYRYLQSRIRYVSIQLGIGGWRPFSPAYVHERGYGDCKALSHYAVALLDAVGVKAYPVVIYSGHAPRPMVEEFPSNQFNHEIVCVPLPGDTLWLECTSRTSPFGHLGDYTEDRGALMLTPRGGVVIRTPATTSRHNAQRRIGTISFIWTGGAEALVRTASTGDELDNVRSVLAEATPEARQKWALQEIPASNPALKKLEVAGMDIPEDTITVTLGFNVPHLATASGSRMFFTLNLMERTVTVPSSSTIRRSPVRLTHPYQQFDSLVYRLPSGFAIEALPQAVKLTASFGSYAAATARLGDTAVVYTRMLDFRSTVIPLENYAEYRTFLTDVARSDRSQAVLIKK